jgi:VIT1/CCC1 family predicted Fe2+/Mn2+ transporter
MLAVASPKSLRPVLAASKVRGLSVYSGPLRAGHVMPTAVGDVGGRHRGAKGGTLRAAIFGVNDGILSNTSLLMGVAAAGVSPQTALLSGVAGLLAGAFSMAAGEFISVRTQREMFEHQIGQEREELEMYPAEEAEELALIYAARGLPIDEARAVATKLVADPKHALDVLAREELGLNPDDLGSPFGAAWSSFAAFAAGASIPLAPFLLRMESAALIAAGLASLALFAVGAAVSLFSGRNALMGGVRMVAIGALAAGATFLVGKAFGVATA